jgi:PqqD family protein of HPr-rel-A system
LRHREWDGEHVFYHGSAGDTHQLSAAAAAVLLELMAGPADETRLAARLSEFDGGSPEEAQAALADILRELARLECAEHAV